MSIEDRIRATREEKEISQVKFAELVGLKPLEVSRIERGKRRAYPPELIIKISEVLNVHIDWLFTGKGTKEILASEQVDKYLGWKKEELDKMTKQELIMRHEQTRAQLKNLEKQLVLLLGNANFDA